MNLIRPAQNITLSYYYRSLKVPIIETDNHIAKNVSNASITKREKSHYQFQDKNQDKQSTHYQSHDLVPQVERGGRVGG